MTLRPAISSRARPARWLLRALPWLLLLAAAGDWLGLKTGRIGHPPRLLAVLVGGAALAFLLRSIVVLRELLSGRRRHGAPAGELLLLAGILVALGSGLANWLLGLQGFVVLHEGEGVPLHGGSHLQHFEAGPWSRIGEMDLTLALVEVELRPAGNGFFYPESLLELRRGSQEPVRITISRQASGAAGSLRFFQGAFGFAPRIVILRGTETVFDRVVPFTSERRGPAGVSFGGRFTLERERLEVEGAVDLASLDEGMRGHATLHLAVRKEGAPLGRGSLLPGHFAEIERGYRIGFAGLEKWSEIDISRRSYGPIVVVGAGLALVGAVLWPLAWWRGW